MAVIAKQRYKLDIAPKGGWVIVYASQHDDGAREIEFEITNQGNAFSIPASINVSVQGIKSNKSYFSHSCSYSGNIVTMALDDDMTDVIGKAICVLKFTNSSQQKLATAKFILNVDSDSSSEGVIIDTDAEEIFNQMLNDIRAQAASVSADIAELQSMVGSPLVASTASAMTDHNKIYVYTGSESGYVNGNWYYWSGSAWTSGGVYNAVAINVDTTPINGSTNVVTSGGVWREIDNTYQSVIPVVFESGGITASGGVSSTNTRIRTNVDKAPFARNGDYVLVDSSYEIKIIAYSTNVLSASYFIGSTDAFENGKIKIPSNFIGYYISLLIRKVGATSSDISGDVVGLGDHISYNRIQSLKFQGDASGLGYSDFSDIKKTGIYQIKKGFVNSASDSPVKPGQTTGGYLIVVEVDGALFQTYYHRERAMYQRYAIGNNFYPWGHMFLNNGAYGTGNNFSDIVELGASVLYNTMFKNANDSPEKSNTKGGVMFSVPFSTNGMVQVVHSANGGSYIRLRGGSSDVFQEWVSLGGDFEPWKNLRVSMLGDSISTFAGYIPSENVSYYSGSNHGVTNVNQMWWYNAIINNGGTPLILDAWSGSLVCKDVRQPTQANSYKPMSNPERCQNLHGYVLGSESDYDLIVTSENIGSIRVSPFDSYVPAIGDYAKRVNPDIIFMTGGGNDYSYDAPLGTWNGHTDLDPTALSTFREAYANTLNLIREEYPNALVICFKPWFFVRPGFSVLDRNQVNRNNLGNTYKDYFDAIDEVAELMACPVVDGFSNGFNRYNYYSTFCTDASNNPTHPTGLGQKIMGENLANQLKDICSGYIKWLRGIIS